MYDRQFWNSKLGQAATASVLAMAAMVALTTQFQAAPGSFAGASEMIAAIEEAQRTLPEFLAVLENPPKGVSYMSFKFPLGGWEHIWVGNVRFDGSHLTGQLSNVPQQTDWSQGDQVRVPLTTVSDWAWLDADGVMRGHHITRVILTRIDPARAARIRSNLGWDQ